MVSVEAASLLAQVLPVGVIALMFESRHGIRGYDGTHLAARVIRTFYWSLFSIGALSGLAATVSSVTAVVQDTALTGLGATVVLTEAVILWVAVMMLALSIAVNESGLGDVIGRVADRSEARKAGRQGRHEK
jgi:hypothetical protein